MNQTKRHIPPKAHYIRLFREQYNAYYEPAYIAYDLGYTDAQHGQLCEPIVTWDKETKEAYRQGFEDGRL